MKKYRSAILCMTAVMIIVAIYSAIAQQSPGAPPYMRPMGAMAKIAELNSSVAALQQSVAELTQYCTDLADYCLDDAYQRTTDMQDTITLYQRLLDEGRMTVVTKSDGSTLLIADWLPTISAAMSDVDVDITALEAH